MEIKISQVKTGERFRKDMGDLQGLADSMKELGQLQPIGIDSNYNLIFGARRIKACELLGQDKVNGRIIHLKDIIKGEYAENEVRKDFTISECVAIGEAIEKELGERRGKPTKDIPVNLPEFKGKDTRELAAKKAGLGSGKTYESAKKTINNGSPELIEKLNNKEISISAAAKISDLDKDQQKEIIEEIDNGTKPAQAIKQKTQQSGNDELDEHNKLYISAAHHFFAYPDTSIEGLQQYLSAWGTITKKRTIEIIKALEKNEVISKINDNGSRYLGLMPRFQEKTATTDEQQQKKNNNIANQTTSEPTEPQEQLLRIDHLVQVARQLLLQKFEHELTELDLTSHYQTTYSDVLKKTWLDHIFLKPAFCDDLEEEINAFLQLKDLRKAAIIITPLEPSSAWFKTLTQETDEFCLPNKKLSLITGISKNNFYSTNIAIFYLGSSEIRKYKFDSLYSQIGSVWK